MTSSVVPPSPDAKGLNVNIESYPLSLPQTGTPSSHYFQSQESADAGTSAGAGNLLRRHRTFVLHPPALSGGDQQQNIIHVSLADPLLTVASNAILSVYHIDVESGLLPTSLTHVSPSRSPSTLIAQWPCPSGHAIAAIALSLDASVIAVITHRPRQTAAVVLLQARTCALLLRLALPASFSYVSITPRGHHPVTFVSATPGMMPSNAPPSDVLPVRLRDVLHKSAAASNAGAAPSFLTSSWNDVAPWTLAVSSNLPSEHVMLISFRHGYRRVHHIAYITIPAASLTTISAWRRLNREKEIVLGLQTERSAFRLVNTSFDQLVSQADVRFYSVVGCNDSAAVATCVRANCSFAIAAINESCLTLSGTNIRVGDVRASALLVVPGFGTAITVVTAQGFPIVVATVLPKKRKSLPHLHIVKSEAAVLHADDEWGCPENANVALMSSGDSVVSVYPKGKCVVVRVIMPAS